MFLRTLLGDKCIPGERKFLARDLVTFEMALWNFKAVECFTLPFLKLRKQKDIYQQTIVVDNTTLFVVTSNGMDMVMATVLTF